MGPGHEHGDLVRVAWHPTSPLVRRAPRARTPDHRLFVPAFVRSEMRISWVFLYCPPSSRRCRSVSCPELVRGSGRPTLEQAWSRREFLAVGGQLQRRFSPEARHAPAGRRTLHQLQPTWRFRRRPPASTSPTYRARTWCSRGSPRSFAMASGAPATQPMCGLRTGSRLAFERWVLKTSTGSRRRYSSGRKEPHRSWWRRPMARLGSSPIHLSLTRHRRRVSSWNSWPSTRGIQVR